MATYIDHTALIGIKISSTGSLARGDSAFTVPSNSYAEIYILSPETHMASGSEDIYANKIIAVAGDTIDYQSNGNIVIGGVTVTDKDNVFTRVKFVVFTNNQ
tara:strand:- start:104 stop:409 length:306 start_codon:yes stop_codon:yes gene_type:complete